MKKLMHLLAVAVALMLTLSTLLTATGASALYGNISNLNSRSITEFSTLLDVSLQSANGEAGQVFKSYTFVEQGKSTLKWKDIKSGDLTIGLQWDVSKIIRKPGKLILSSVAATGNKALSVSDCESAAVSDILYAIYTITAIAPKPAPINKSKIIYTDTAAFIDIGVDNEWSKDGFTWRSADNNGPNGKDTADKWCSVTPSAEKQTVFVRGKAKTSDANNITLSSLKSIKVTIPAIPKPPKVNFYLAKGFLSTRAGMEISNDEKTWAKMTTTTLPLSAVTELPAAVGNGVVKIDLNNNNDVYIRKPAGNGKPASDTFETRIKFKVGGNVSAEHFTTAPNMKILIDSSVVVEAFINGKWKKIKKIDANSIPADGLKIRMSGAKDRLPGPESILKLVSNNGHTEISIISA